MYLWMFLFFVIFMVATVLTRVPLKKTFQSERDFLPSEIKTFYLYFVAL